MGGLKSGSGEQVRKQYNIPALQVRFHHKGDFYMPLEKFPGALADTNGYVIISNEEEYLRNSKLNHRGSSKNPRLGVHGGISSMPGYVKFQKGKA